MDDTVSAEAHLKVIRSLMERATVYRAISSATAAVGGLASIAAAVYLITRNIPDPWEFLIIWGAVLLITVSANAYFISLGAEKRGEPFFSRGMKTTLIGAIPSLGSGGLMTFVLFNTCGVAWCSAFWMMFYGLALVSSFHFAPRSVLWLGLAFLLSSWTILLLLFWDLIQVEYPAYTGSYLMAGSFGLLHLIYAVATWPRKGGFMAALELNR